MSTTPVLYRSSFDGWRTGEASDFSNTHKVTVFDAITSLQETVPPKDVFVPENKQLLSMPSNFYLSENDLASLEPSPLEALPTLVQAIRSRYEAGRDATLVGDNVLLHHRHAGLPPLPLEAQGTTLFSRRLLSAFRANHCTQVVHVNGDSRGLDVAQSIAGCLCTNEDFAKRVNAALAVINPFCSTVNGSVRAHVILRLLPTSETATIDVKMLDLRNVTQLYDGTNFSVFGSHIHGQSPEERERSVFPKGEFDFRVQPSNLDVSCIDRLRLQYLSYRRSLDVLGVDMSAQMAISARISAIAQLLQVRFDESGGAVNVVPMKNAARALQTDFTSLSRLLTSEDACRVAAELLYQATVQGLLRRVNAALNPSGSSPSTPSIILNVIPSVLAAGHGSRSLLLHTLQEDMLQSFFRTSETEIVQWQRSGFAVSERLQFAFDPCDNFDLLKLLRGQRGILASVRLDDGSERNSALLNVARNKSCTFDPATQRLSILHSSGERRVYDLAGSMESRRLDATVFSPEYVPIKDFLFQNTDADTQEAILLAEQFDVHRSKDDAEVSQSKALLNILSDEACCAWWVKVLNTSRTGVFEGDLMETQLLRNHVFPVTLLRKLLPRRFIPCSTEFIATEFKGLAPPGYKRDTAARKKAEAILGGADVHYLVSKDSFLIEASAVTTLYERLDSFQKLHVSIIQAFARGLGAELKLRRRVANWQEAMGVSMARINAASDQYRHHLEHEHSYKQGLLDLQEKEQVERSVVREQCWIEWVALQTDMQTTMDGIIQRAVTDNLKDEERKFQAVLAHRRASAMDDLSTRVQERLMLQGAHLDGIVVAKNRQLEAAKRRLEAVRNVNQRRINVMAGAHERKVEIRQDLHRKSTASTRVAADREKKAATLRDEQWARHERDRLARMEMERARDTVAERMREKFVMEGIEHNIAKRLASEVTERNKKVREAEEMMMRAERKERERELAAIEKKAEDDALRDKRILEQRRQQEASRKRLLAQRQWSAQERERIAVEKLQAEERRQDKRMTSALINAHTLLSSPQLFDQSGRRVTRGTKVQCGSSGMTMSNGQSTYGKMLTNDAVDALTSFHGEGGQRNRAASPGAMSL